MSKNLLTIFSVFHKKHAVPQCDFIVPIQVNKCNTGIETGFITDDTGDNISQKNESFCELTAIYWIWKNIDTMPAKYIGLSHYRRYFTNPIKASFFSKLNGLLHSKKQEIIIQVPLNEDTLRLASNNELQNKLLDNLEKGYVIVPNKKSFRVGKRFILSIKNQFIFTHLREDWEILEAAIKKIHPDYADSLSFFESETKMHCYNMFVGDKAFFKNYCSWLFPLLFEIKANIPLSPYPYQRRIIGFMAERLFNLYLYKNNIKTVELPLVYFE